MDLVGHGSNRDVASRLGAIRNCADDGAGHEEPILSASRRRRRVLETERAIVAVLGSADALRVRDIVAGVSALLDDDVSSSTVKNCLVRGSTGRGPRFARIRRGVYGLAE
jgi:hypothetical protein